MSIENRPEKYIWRLLSTLAIAVSLRSSEALPHKTLTINKVPAPAEFKSPIHPFHQPRSEENLITPTPTESVSHPWLTPEDTEDIFFPSPTSTSTPTLTPIPSPTPTKEAVTPKISLSPWEEKTYQAINELRNQRNLPTLKLSEPLIEVARQRSLDMATRNYFNHTTPEGLMVFDLLDRTGNYYPYVGESLFRTDADDSQIDWAIQEAIRKFLKSQAHKRNLLRLEFSLIGIGYAFSEEDNIRYITIVFASLPR